MSRPIKAYWWRRLANFGDAINPDIIAHVSGRPVEYVPAEEAEIIAIGSNLDTAPKNKGRGPLYVWGTGALTPRALPRPPHVVYCALRGPLSADVVTSYGVTFGDPGLLISDIVPRREANGRIGVVLHHAHKPDAELQALAARRSKKIEIIDPVNDDHLETVRRISACTHIFSSSLHGLVVADAYGIPSTWLDPAGNHDFPRFKFRDYAAGIGRNLGMPLRMDDFLDLIGTFTPSHAALPHQQTVEETKRKLRAAFPKALRAGS